MAEYKYPEQESCPIVHEDRDIQIYTNSCGEVFVEHKATKVVMRFSGDQKEFSLLLLGTGLILFLLVVELGGVFITSSILSNTFS